MIPLYQVDAFTEELFSGNPAVVVLLERWVAESFMQQVAAETKVADTAFVVPTGKPGAYEIRWFTPRAEVPLCGHATLATGWVLFERRGVRLPTLRFASKSGELRVARRDDGRIELDFPVRPIHAVADGSTADPTLFDAVADALGARPLALHASSVNYVAFFATEAEVRALAPTMPKVAALDRSGVVVTARGDSVDFVSRYFAPAIGVDEDPVTGSAHCETAPYWAEKLGRSRLVARQVSARGGELLCEVVADRVKLAGFVAPFLEGTIASPGEPRS